MTAAEDPKAHQRQRVILEHLRGRMNATQAALELGVSRKTFYQWRDRALDGMLGALRERPTGRPPQPVDPEKVQLLEEVEALEKERTVLQGRLRIQEAIRQTLNAMQEASAAPEKKRSVARP